MAIRLHSFVSSGKRYIQVETQSHHITAIFNKILRFNNVKHSNHDLFCAHCECQEDGTITFYQAERSNSNESGIWTYLVYDCPQGEEKVFRDTSINTSTNLLKELLHGRKIVQQSGSIYEYLQQKYAQTEYLDIELPDDWNHEEGRKIAAILVEEYQALKSLPVFTQTTGKEYVDTVLNAFITAALRIMKNCGTAKDFESAQYDTLDKIKIDEVAYLILEYNDYRIWQAALPSTSKAVEYVFNSALSLICQN